MNFFSKFSLKIPVRRRTLSWKLPEGKNGRFPIKADSFSVGRQAPNDVVIEHESISRRHARLSLEYDQLYVEDMASTRGTWIGGERVRPYARTLVPPETSLWIGQVELTFEKVDAVQIPLLPFLLAFLFLCCCGVPVVLFINRPLPSVSLACEAETSYLITLPDVKATQVAEVPIEATPSITVTETITDSGEITDTENLPPTPVVSIPTDTEIYNSETNAYTTIQFLDLPIPYNGTNTIFGGNQEQFEIASQSTGQGGRINSFFDHYYPIYPFYNGGAEEEETSKYLLLFNGALVQDLDSWGAGYWYSGHPGYDFRGNASTPIFAAANGFIDYVGPDNCKAQKGNMVKILHTVEGYGDYETVYMHLQDDTVYQNWLTLYNSQATDNSIFVSAGTQIGTMGETGCANGLHLHFEVRFDRDGESLDGDTNRFDQSEVVDPFGYIPSLEFPEDRWRMDSYYLWKHSLGTVANPTQGKAPSNPAKGGIGNGLRQDAQTRPELCAPRESLPTGGTVYFSLSLSPPPAKDLVSIAKAITFVVLNTDQTIISEFEQDILVTLPYTEGDLQNVDPETLGIRRLNIEANAWEYVETVFDRENQIAGAKVDRPGQYALFAVPTSDQAPPQTTIKAEGMRTAEGTWCGPVTVTIASEDDRSGIRELTYRLRDGMDWVITSQLPEPFTLQAEGKPAQISEGEGDAYPSGNGRYWVQAKATDGNNNAEYLPTSLYIVIDPTIPASQCQASEETSAIPKNTTGASIPVFVYYIAPLVLTGVFWWFIIRRKRSQK